MRALQLLLLAALAATTQAQASDVRLGDDVVPVSQAIDLKLDAGQSEYTGSVTILLDVRRETDRFLLHSENQDIRQLTLVGLGGQVETAFDKEADDLLHVRAAAPLTPGRYKLDVAFSSPFGTKAVGLYRMEKDGVGYAFTQFEADDAREAFPCWDEPRFKIPFQVTLSVPEDHVAVTNTPEETSSTAGGWRTVKFKQTKPLPTYLLAIATGPLEIVDMPGLSVPGRILTVQGQSHLTGLALEMTPPLLEALETYFASAHPFGKIDFLAIPEFWAGAMENPGAITYADGVLLVDEQSASTNTRRVMAIVIAHELAHQWFGNLVTMEWWDDLWLNEAFANWMGEKIAHEVFPELGLDVTGVQSIQGILGQDARASTEPIRRPVDSAADLLRGLGITYVKGSAVISMFERWMGPEVFRRGVNAYLKAHAWGNATSDDLWRALDEASGKPVAEALVTFVDQPGFPTLAVEILEAGKVKLTQQRFRNHGSSSPDQLWKIPVTLRYPTSGATETRTLLLDSPSITVDLDLPEDERPAWIYPNASASGYYHWTLAPEPMRRLAAGAGSVLSSAERIELLGNVAALLESGVLGGGDYLDVVSSLAGDPDPLVVRAAVRELSSVKSAFVTAELEDAFAGYVRRTLTPALESIGLEKKPGEDEAASLVRPTLIGWLGKEGRDEEIVERARGWMRSYLKDPASLDPSLVTVALGLAVVDADRELYEELRGRFESAETPAERSRFLSVLGAFEDPELRQEALDYALTGPLRPNEMFTIASSLGSSAAEGDLLFDWITANWDKIMERLPPVFASSMPFIAGGCSLERLERGRKFFLQPERNLPGVEKQLEKVAEQVEDCVALRRREGAAVSRYLLGSR